MSFTLKYKLKFGNEIILWIVFPSYECQEGRLLGVEIVWKKLSPFQTLNLKTADNPVNWYWIVLISGNKMKSLSSEPMQLFYHIQTNTQRRAREKWSLILLVLVSFTYVVIRNGEKLGQLSPEVTPSTKHRNNLLYLVKFWTHRAYIEERSHLFRTLTVEVASWG